MGGIKISDLVDALIRIEKTAGKPISLKLGDVLRAEVVDLLPTGGVTLKIKDSYVTARTEVPIRENSSVFVKVLGSTGSDAGKELRLQLLGYAGESGGEGQAKTSSHSALNGLMKELSGVLATEEGYARDFSGIAERLLKTLPSDTIALPKEMRSQLQDLLKSGLGSVQTSIQERIGGLLELLKSDPESGAVLSALKDGLMLEGEKPAPGQLRAALENTGVGFEARLKTLAAKVISSREPAQGAGGETARKTAGASGGAPSDVMSPRATVGKGIAGDFGSLPLNTADLGGEPIQFFERAGVKSASAADLVSALPPKEGEEGRAEEADGKPLIPLTATLSPKAGESGRKPSLAPSEVLETELEKPARTAVAAEGERVAAPPEVGEEELKASAFAVGGDLKHGLLQLKRALAKRVADMSGRSPSETGESVENTDRDGATREKMLESINSLLRDIEGYQVLSKVTDSFCTFLPIVWKELKEGQIAFKRGRPEGKGVSYYCMVNLDFDKIGRLDTMILMQGRDYFVSFKCENAEFRSILNSQSLELQNIFKRNGMNLGSVNVLRAEDTSLQHFERLESLEGLLNIRI